MLKISDRVWGAHGVNDSIKSAYLSGVQKTGRAGGFSEQIATGQAHGKVTKVKVKGAGGDRVVTLTDALRYYRDQVDRGDIEVVEGADEYKGQTLAQAMGGQVQGDIHVTSADDKKLAQQHHGKDAGTYQAKGQQGGRILIQPTPELARYFKFTGQGSAFGDPNSPLSPPPSQTTPDARSVTGIG